jgi:hypothetical protein
MEKLLNSVGTTELLILLWIVTILVGAFILFRLFSHFHYGYRSGRRTLRKLGANTWERLSSQNKSKSMRELMDEFRNEIVHFSVSNKLDYWDGKQAALTKERDELILQKSEYESSLKNYEEVLEGLRGELDKSFTGIAHAVENNSLEMQNDEMQGLSFEEEYKVRKQEIDDICLAINKNIDELESRITVIETEFEEQLNQSTPLLKKVRNYFVGHLQVLKKAVVVLILFLVEFGITYDAFKQVWQSQAINDLLYEILPYLAGMIIPLTLIGVYAVVYSLKDRKGVFTKIIYKLFILCNVFALIAALYLFVKISIEANVDAYVDYMWRLLLFPIVLLTTILIEQGEQREKGIMGHYNILFVIPELIGSGLLILFLGISISIKKLIIRTQYWSKIRTERVHQNALRKQIEKYQNDLELFYTEYIEGLVDKFNERLSYKEVIKEIDQSKTNFVEDLGKRVNEVSTSIEKTIPALKTKITAISKQVEQFDSYKHKVIEGVHAVIKKKFSLPK